MDAVLHHGDELLVAQKAVAVVVEDLQRKFGRICNEEPGKMIR